MAAREIDPRGAKPPFRQVAAILAAEIKAGKLAPGSPVPSEANLSERFGVARNTVRAALGVLRDDGLVHTVPSRGTYVSDPSDQAEPEDG
ncbi:winged helix-turn-helix domain-containing protein [Kitasatospora purpeofusca]|uniref:GntR family transcriptional regulator n=1 Tax=Kitasatospora purpeofusca TaxID=67352 RepID=UPI002254BC07|nr:winged helix-turn-helix domain-containing protein [Kitasatospora purpeofusca]MCX4686177.1 winged helix-turn-helix domain-containing protein [Kitasatospora purpeofusca]